MRARNVLCNSYRITVEINHFVVYVWTYYMYKSSLRHIHDPVLSSLKMKGIRLLYFILHMGSFVDDMLDLSPLGLSNRLKT
jgi:hypothetical protein